MQGSLNWKLERDGDGWKLELHLPGGLIAAGRGASKPEALHKAATFAKAALSSPAVQAALPPGTMPAVTVALGIARSPSMRKVVSDYGPRGARKLAKAIGSLF